MIKTLLTIGILMIGLSHSLACSCEEPGTVKESYGYADIVVYGTVVSRSNITFRETMESDKGDSLNDILSGRFNDLLNSEQILKIEFEIKKIYKGSITSDTITIYTGRSSASCGFSWFKEGEDYIIYGSSESYSYGLFTNGKHENLEKYGTYWTNHCSRTTEYNEQEAKELDNLTMK